MAPARERASAWITILAHTGKECLCDLSATMPEFLTAAARVWLRFLAGSAARQRSCHTRARGSPWDDRSRWLVHPQQRGVLEARLRNTSIQKRWKEPGR